MKTTISKTNSQNHNLHSSKPFFEKGESNDFFSSAQETKKPFFSPPSSKIKPSFGMSGVPQSPEESLELGIGGRTIGEAIGDFGRVVGTGVGNVVGDVAGALTGITISANDTTPPTFRDHGEFEWVVGWNTSGRNGWIVQEIVNTYRTTDNSGNDLTPPLQAPRYWEAWAVDGAGNVTPGNGGSNDWWTRIPMTNLATYYGNPAYNTTEGHWSMRGKVYFTTTDPATMGFVAGAVSDAGILLSTTSAPSNLGIARLHRYAQGTWDSTGTTNTHEGSAR